jgi:hypothetical protein
MQFEEFLARVVNPHWVHDPLSWQVDKLGIAHFAMDGKVGLFNLSWWLLDLPAPPKTAKGYEAIMNSANVRVGNKELLTVASMYDQMNFETMILSQKLTGLTATARKDLVDLAQRKVGV